MTGAPATAEDAADLLGLTQPDIGDAEIRVVERILRTANLNDGRMTEAFEEAFAAYVGRAHAVAVTSGTMALRSRSPGPGPFQPPWCRGHWRA
jgi:perosamine synthetase